jgi:radical SAM protein with 4Fe4S-binding SPASM domain
MEWELLEFGSILERSFAEVLQDSQKVRLRERTELLSQTECKGCEFWKVCHGGCPLEGWQTTGSLMSRTRLCQAKKDFIRKYFEPTVKGENTAKKAAAVTCLGSFPSAPVTPSAKSAARSQNGSEWINLKGGLGDALILSGVLKQMADKFPSRKFNLVSRANCDPILSGHPAIAQVGYPPPGSRLKGTDYWEQTGFGPNGHGEGRAYQVLARMFGLEPPVVESLWVPFPTRADGVLDGLPFKRKNVLLCPTADSPRKQMSLPRWEELARLLSGDDTFIAQAGRQSDPYVRGTYSLLGLTNPKELMSLLPGFQAVITLDGFVLHAAHLCGVPAVVLWGPTDHRIYGYEKQTHFQAVPTCECKNGCIGPGASSMDHTPCPQGAGHCLDQLDLQDISRAVRGILENKEITADMLPRA